MIDNTKEYPKFVKMYKEPNTSFTCLRLVDENEPIYFRGGGDWTVSAYFNENNELISKDRMGCYPHLTGMTLIECSKEDYLKDNGSYDQCLNMYVGE